MSKIKTNPSQIKDCIIAVKKSDLSDSKKDTITMVLQQYTHDKQDGVYSDGLIKQLLFDLAMELKYHTNSMREEDMMNKLLSIIDNMDKRKYF